MRIVVIRHAEVDFGWNRQCTSEGFDSDCAEYDIAPIKGIIYEIPQITFQKIYISELSRSRDTAEKLFPDEVFVKTGLINEVPLRSSFDINRKIPLWFWNFSGRLQWFFNSSRQAEGRDQTRRRARQFVKIICEENLNCAVITHGFYMHTLLREMKKTGFMTNKSNAGYKNGEYVIAEK